MVLNRGCKKLRELEKKINNGGSSLPTYTLEDEDKVLTVEKVEESTTSWTVIQNQTVTFHQGEGQLGEDTYSETDLTDGDTILVSIAEEEYSCIYNASEHKLSSENDQVVIVLSGSNSGRITAPLGSSSTGVVASVSGVKTAVTYKAEPGWKAASGGSDAFTITVNVDEFGNCSADKNFSEISAAFNANKHFYGKIVTLANGTQIAPAIVWGFSDDDYFIAIVFTQLVEEQGTVSMVMEQYAIHSTPSETTAEFLYK